MVAGLNEKLSALVDGELPNEELSVHLAVLKGDVDARAAWDACHLIGDVLRGHVTPDICAHVVRRLEAEPTVLAPRTRSWARSPVAAWAMSLAAGAAAVALVIWTVLPNMRGEIQVAQTPALSPMPSAEAPPAMEISDYLLAHQRYSATSAMQGVAPYVRTVAYEGGAR